MRWRIAALLAVMLAGIAAAQTVGEEDIFNDDKFKYVVRKGDTLWDIAGRFLEHPYDWPLIWQQNPQIEDPHWIYPGDVLTIIPEAVLHKRKIASLPGSGTGRAEAAEGGRPETVEGVAIAPVENQVTFTPNKIIGFMSATELSNIVGSINGSPTDKKNYSHLDLVYLNVGEKSGIKVGDKFTVIRLIKKVKHPVTKKNVGYFVLTIGTLEVLVVYPSLSTAKITYSNQDILDGDKIVPLMDIPRTVRYKDAPEQYRENPLEAYVIMSRNMLPYMGRDEIAYIDVGKKHGIEPGNLFEAYIPGGWRKDPTTKQKIKDPDEIIGELVVLMTSDDYSTVLVTKSKKEFPPGTHLRIKRFGG